MYVCMFIHTHIDIYLYLYIYIHIYTHIYTFFVNYVMRNGTLSVVILIKHNEYKITTKFCNKMFSFVLWLLIDKPSRIITDSDTLSIAMRCFDIF